MRQTNEIINIEKKGQTDCNIYTKKDYANDWLTKGEKAKQY